MRINNCSTLEVQCFLFIPVSLGKNRGFRGYRVQITINSGARLFNAKGRAFFNHIGYILKTLDSIGYIGYHFKPLRKNICSDEQSTENRAPISPISPVLSKHTPGFPRERVSSTEQTVRIPQKFALGVGGDGTGAFSHFTPRLANSIAKK